MRTIAASEFNGLSGKVIVDWNRLSPYAASGAFMSRVFDAGVKTNWQSLQSVAKPSASSVAIVVRTGNSRYPTATGAGSGPLRRACSRGTSSTRRRWQRPT